MGVRNEFESNIYSNWNDRRVARWVVDRLPLLERAFSKPPCPVFTLSLDGTLDQIDGEPFDNFKETPKLLMSGGFEGTNAHIQVAKEMRDAKALSMSEDSLCVFLLEPDSYISQKGRDPIFDIHERVTLWSTSGLLDGIVCLPEKSSKTDISEHYLNIHQALSPAGWCSNPENPSYFEIVTRMREQESFELIRLFKNQPEIHSSFLDSTRKMKVRQVNKTLKNYVFDLVKKSDVYSVARYNNSKDLAQIAKMEYKRLSKGLHRLN